MPRGQRQACPLPGCPHIRYASHVMCRSHWRKVSPATKKALNRCWNLWKSRGALNASPAALDDLWQAYKRFRQDAIDEAGAKAPVGEMTNKEVDA